MIRCIVPALPAPLMTGCAISPSISVLGSYFPDWLFCLVAGLLLTLVTQAMFARALWTRSPGSLVIVQSLLFTLFSLLTWLVFFQH